MGISSIRDLLTGSAFNKPGIRRSVRASMVVQAANRIIPGLRSGGRASDIVAVSFKDGILRLRANSAAARYSVRTLEPALCAKLHEAFPSIAVKRIQVWVSKEPQCYELA